MGDSGDREGLKKAKWESKRTYLSWVWWECACFVHAVYLGTSQGCSTDFRFCATAGTNM